MTREKIVVFSLCTGVFSLVREMKMVSIRSSLKAEHILHLSICILSMIQTLVWSIFSLILRQNNKSSGNTKQDVECAAGVVWKVSVEVVILFPTIKNLSPVLSPFPTLRLYLARPSRQLMAAKVYLAAVTSREILWEILLYYLWQWQDAYKITGARYKLFISSFKASRMWVLNT